MMRPEHSSLGNPCAKCGLAALRHRKRKRPSGRDHRTVRIRKRISKPRPTKQKERYFVGIDGEGRGRSPHRYTLLAWSNESGNKSDFLECDAGLRTKECLDFLLSIPKEAKVFSFAFTYDLTKILEDLPNELLYDLFRPERRRPLGERAAWGPYPIRWGDYSLNLQGSKFTIRRLKSQFYPKPHTRVIWDVFKFYQQSFVTALEKWSVGQKDEVAFIEGMKKNRSRFNSLPLIKIREYCQKECQFMAELARNLVDAHENAGIKLRSFYGAGSTGGALLKQLGIKEKRRNPPREMVLPVASAFFGGRFEHSVQGPEACPIYGYDIASAYPYQIANLPCLVHGQWERTRSRTRVMYAKAALVRYKLREPSANLSWGPFPFRFEDGSSCFPVRSGGGWVWRDEYLWGETLYNNVQFCEAWALESDCDCKPFERIPEYYLKRIEWGKDGRGIVLKLGLNSMYGKLAQSVGNPPYQCWIWAGIVTSGTRSQILGMQSLHKNDRNLLAIATDGIYTRERINPFEPWNTGTNHLSKPLGSWEEKVYPNGVFFVRPGIYFPLDATEAELKEVRGRGVGKTTMMRCRELAQAAWEKREGKMVFPSVDRFWGAKTAIHPRGDEFIRSDRFGAWDERAIELSFDPLPKRAGIAKDYRRLLIRKLDTHTMSSPYNPAIVAPEAMKMRRLTDEALEQPDGGEGDNFAELHETLR